MASKRATPAGPGANDNASGVGVVMTLARRLERARPRCDVWLVATGAEERVYTGSPDHLGALALVRRVRARGLRVAAALGALARRGWPRPRLLAALARVPGASASRRRAAARGAPRGCTGPVGPRRDDRKL
ncbi:MAG: M28 family peptidase [Thermoleophilaceae bacterium]|nr:M28 family peptidase [Thermoleophilaceae bacterium]